jgi:hypothetical protein
MIIVAAQVRAITRFAPIRVPRITDEETRPPAERRDALDASS